MRVVGIDVGSRRLDAVALDGDGGVVDSRVFAASDTAAVVDWARGAQAVAVDAPDRWSTAPHHNQVTLSPKFRSARCGEIGLGLNHRIWVPWTTPVEPAPGTWIDVGITLFAALRAAGHEPIEVFPYATFFVLNGRRRPPPKRLHEGTVARVALLRGAGVSDVGLDVWGHDGLDAAAAALVALHHADGRAVAGTCGHDGSAIWLPDSATGVAEPSTAPF